MSEAKFTKGEWHWKYDESTASMIQVGCDSGSDVCRLQSEDNANLIAVAPEMYDMLDSIENDGEQVPQWLWDKIQLTLAKARGE